MPAALVSDRSPFPRPPLGAPLRVVFAGPAPTFSSAALHAPAGGLEPHFLDVRPGANPRAAIEAAAPHVVIASGVPAGALDGIRAATLGIDAEEGFDRVLRTPGSQLPAWRVRPLPVDDRLFADVRPSRRPPRALAIGRSTERREWILTPAKHDHDVVHYAHGLEGEALIDVLAAADVGIALNATPVHGFPSQALLHLAAGHLLLSERLVPTCGLEPGIDFIELDSRDSLLTLLMQLKIRPDAYERVRVRGRLKAEEHRASRVWPRIVRDLLQDLRAFGTANTLEG